MLLLVSAWLFAQYDSSADVLLFIGEHIFLKEFLENSLNSVSFLHNPFEIIPNKMIKHVIVYVLFVSWSWLKLILLEKLMYIVFILRILLENLYTVLIGNKVWNAIIHVYNNGETFQITGFLW